MIVGLTSTFVITVINVMSQFVIPCIGSALVGGKLVEGFMFGQECTILGG